MYNFIARNILAPVLDLFRGTGTLKQLSFLEKSQWWPPQKIAALQDEKLRKLVLYSYEKVPYYRRLFDEKGLKPDDIKTSKDLAALPILTKGLIRENLQDLTAAGFPENQLIKMTTAGSTGEPLFFHCTKDGQYSCGYAAEQRAYGWAGISMGDKWLSLGIRRQKGNFLQDVQYRVRRLFERALAIDRWDINEGSLPGLIKRLKRFKPVYFRGFPGFVHLMARVMEDRKMNMVRPKAIVTCGEALQDFQRENVEKAFGCKCYSSYGAAEGFSIAFECPTHNGFHIAAEHFIVEIVDDAGQPVPPGLQGRVLITNLHNYAMPFIRYDIGDIGSLPGISCNCGRGLPLMNLSLAKTTDFLATRSRGTLPGMSLPMAFFADWGVQQYQVVQDDPEGVTVYLAPAAIFPAGRREALTKETVNRFKLVLGDDMDINVKFVDQVPVSKYGSWRVVVSNLNSNHKI
jgi:phenylacetate-CoA ligase